MDIFLLDLSNLTTDADPYGTASRLLEVGNTNLILPLRYSFDNTLFLSSKVD